MSIPTIKRSFKRSFQKALVPGFLGLALLLTGLACRGEVADKVGRAELGSQIYQQNCVVCHGIRGEGQPGWQIKRPDGSYPAPPHNAGGHTWHHSDGLLFQIVKSGGASLNIPNFQSGMPAFEQQLEDEEIRAVIDHLKTFWEPQQRELQSQASEQDPFP